jgi:mRNA-degrading endonuclease RelE of RelBE toxin-antitoxin system
VFRIEFTPGALGDLGYFRKAEQAIIMRRIEASLVHQPSVEARQRKPLRPNDLSAWELRIEATRVFYDVDWQLEVVTIKAIGHKERDRLYFRARRYDL